MTQPSVQAQVETIKKVTEKVLQSKEATLKFLHDAGIIEEEKPKKKVKGKK
jgi:hypothetical protein